MSPPPDGVNAQSRWPCGERPLALTVSIQARTTKFGQKLQTFFAGRGGGGGGGGGLTVTFMVKFDWLTG